MKRREFITLLGSAAAWPLMTHAQQVAKVPRIGFLGLGPAAHDSRVEGLRVGLRDLGYVRARTSI
jgi:putative ABC transport system substrate-binding protein